MLRNIRHKVFFKLLIGFLIVGIPMESIGLWASWYGAKIVLEKTNQSMEEKMYLFSHFLEQELSNVNQTLVSLSMDSDLMRFALQRSNPFSYENVTSYDLLISKLKILQFSSEYISNVFMILPKTREVVSYMDGYNQMQNKEYSYLQEMNRTTMNRFLHEDKLVYFSANQDDFVLGVEISQSSIMKSLKTHQGDTGYHVYMKQVSNDSWISPQILTAEERQTINRIHAGEVYGKELIVQEHTSKDQLFTIGFYASKKQLLSSFYSLRSWLWILTSISIVAIILFSWFINHQIHSPLALIVRSMKEVERGKYDSRLLLKKNDEFGYVYKQYNRMAGQLQNLIQEVLEKKIQFQRAQLRHLQAQINPHFLYNCFYNGYRMAKSGQSDNVAKLCKFLGDYFRYVTYTNDKDVSLADEMKYTLTYLEIQKIRYGDRLSFHLDCEVNASEFKLPGLLLQPIVENALIHVLEQQETSTHIDVRITDHDDRIRVEVSDNGPGIDEAHLKEIRGLLAKSENETEHFGLWNIEWRLRYRFGEESHLTIGPSAHREGTLVSFVIPKVVEARGA